MQTKKEQTTTLSEVQTQRAFWLSIGTGVLMLLTLSILLITSRDRPLNGFSDIRVFVSIITLCGFISAWLTRQGRAVLGVSIILGAFYIFVFWTALYIENLGVAVAAVTMTLTFSITSAVFPSTRPARYANTVAGIVSAAVVLLDIFQPFNRNPNDAPEITWGIAIFLVLIYGFLILRQYNTYALRTKLLIAFISVTVIATGILSAFVIITTANNQQENLERELSAVSASHATQVGDLFNEQINNLTTLSLNETLQQAVIEQNGSYTGSASEIQGEIGTKDAQWRAAFLAGNNADPLVREKLTNTAAFDLIEYQTAFPDNVEIFITDIHGALVGSTNRTSDYNQADEAWWQAAYNNGDGGVYISTPEFDESAGNLGIQFAVPLRNRDTGKIIGILRTTYIMTPLAAILQQDVGETSSADIFIPSITDSHIREGLLEPIDPQVFEQLQAVAGQGMAEMDYKGAPSVVTQAQITSRVGNPAVDNLGWVVVFHQDQAEAFAPVNAEIRGILIVILIVIFLAVLAAIFIAQTLVRPLIQLTNTAQEIAAGNLNSQAQVTSSDEIGVLAGAFNSMTSQLREFITSLEDRVAARTKDLATVAEVGTATATILETDKLLQEVVDLTKERFKLYHSHIYLLDEKGENLVLTAGAGEPGRIMVSEKRSIPLNREQSLVARAARERKGVTVNDVTQSPDFLPNPLLPDTRSELAVPMIVGGNVIGVFDIQSDQVGRFTESDINIQTTLAAQVATSIQNVRSFEQSKSQANLESLVNAIGQKIQRSTSVEDTLQIAIRELGSALGASRVSASIQASRENVKVSES